MTRHKARGPPKLPIQQLSILAVCRIAEPIALTSVFPYLPEMIESFGIKKEDVGRWAGITSAVFSLSQFCTAILWGQASDRFGRKTIILLGMSITMICTLLWGFAQSLPWAIASRTLSGAGNGNIGIIRTMVAEMVPQRELQPRAFSLMPLVWTLGSILGPSFGGALAKPATNLPGLFGGNEFLIRFPFALPNLIAVAFFACGIITGILFLKETLETRKHKRDYGIVLGEKLVACAKNRKSRGISESNDDEETSLLDPSSTNPPTKASDAWPPNTKPVRPAPSIREVFNTQTTINLITYSFLACTSMAWDQTVPIFMHHPVQVPDDSNMHLPFKFSGGFGLDSGRIGTIFTLYGIVGALVQFIVFPPVARRFGILNCFKVCSIWLPVVYFVTPYMALIQDPFVQQTVFFIVMVVKSFCIIFAFPCSTILLTNSATSLRILGTLNGVATSVAAIGRAVGPFVTGSVFSWGVEKGYVIAPWFLLGTVSIIGAIPVWWLEEMEGFGEDSDDEDESDDDEFSTDGDRPAVVAAEDELLAAADDEEAIDTIEGPPLVPIMSRSSRRGSFPRERRMSTPIGLVGETIGPGGGRRLSNALGLSNYGHGTGGAAFH